MATRKRKELKKIRSWLVSSNCNEHEFICSSPKKTVLIRLPSENHELTDDVFNDIGSALPAEKIRSEFNRDADVISDVHIAGTMRWQNSNDLVAQLENNSKPIYAFCSEKITDYFNAFKRLQIHQPVVPVLLYGHHLMVGPCLLDHRTPCGACWRTRLLNNLPSLAERVHRGHVLFENPFIQVEKAVAVARALWEAKRPVTGRDQALSIDLIRGEFSWQRFMPATACACRYEPVVGEIQDLKSSHFGPVHSIDIDKSLVTKEVVTVTALGHGKENSSLGTATSFSTTDAELRALGESAERHAAAQAADIATLIPGSDLDLHWPWEYHTPYESSQYEQAGFPYQPLSKLQKSHWIEVCSIADGSESWLPLRLVALDKRCAQPAFAPMTSNGIAAGNSVWDATERALLEIAERDIATRTWFEGEIDELNTKEIASVAAEKLDFSGFSLKLFRCRTPIAINVVIAFIYEHGKPVGAVGTAADLTINRAAVHAVEEAIQMWHIRNPRGQCIPLPQRFSSVPMLKSSPWKTTGDLAELVEHYRPWRADLSCSVSRGAGLHVVGLYSPFAVDFLDSKRPIPKRIWNPEKSIRELIHVEPSAFVLS